MTSVLPNLLVDGIRQALAISQATKVYVCNVATQHGETDDFSVSDHFETLVRHVGPSLFDYVLANDNVAGPLPDAWQAKPLVVDATIAQRAAPPPPPVSPRAAARRSRRSWPPPGRGARLNLDELSRLPDRRADHRLARPHPRHPPPGEGLRLRRRPRRHDLLLPPPPRPGEDPVSGHHPPRHRLPRDVRLERKGVLRRSACLPQAGPLSPTQPP